MAIVEPLIQFLSTLSLRRATPIAMRTCRTETISIHALLAESDNAIINHCIPEVLFLSTLSLRRATFCQCKKRVGSCISIHALLAESDQKTPLLWSHTQNFYPRSPCGERQLNAHTLSGHFQFLSTLSLRRATITTFYTSLFNFISIHALLAESDMMVVRVSMDVAISIHALLAESDGKLSGQHGQLPISIHALLAESDVWG